MVIPKPLLCLLCTTLIWLPANAQKVNIPKEKAKILGEQKTNIVKTWVFEQVDETWGQVTVQVSSAGVRMRNPTNDVSLVATAPDWNVALFSERRKIMCPQNLSEWSKDSLKIWGWHEGLQASHSTKISAINYAGVKATEYRLECPANVEEKSPARNARCYVATEMSAPPEAFQVVAGLYHLPNLGGVPLFCKLTNTSKAVTTPLLDTKKVSCVSMPQSAFQYPVGYQITKMHPVLLSPEKEGMMSDWADDLGK